MTNPILQKTAQHNTRAALSLMAVLIICALSFSSVLGNDFVNWDDPSHLLDNETVRHLNIANIKTIFASLVTKTYIPLTVLSFSIEYHFFRYNPFIYHLNNLILHLGVVALIFFFARQVGLSLRSAFLASLLFGIHPMHVESVAWITERKDVLYSFFYMLALCSYWQYLSCKKSRFYLASIIFGLLSILSKPMAFSLPLILILCDWFSKRKLDRTIVLDKIPCFLYVAPLSIMSYFLVDKIFGINNTALESTLICVRNFIFYLHKFILPINLSPLYSFPTPASLSHSEYLISTVALFTLAALLAIFKNNRWLWFALLFFTLSMFPLLHRDETAYSSLISDRRMYLPSLGFCLLFGAGVDRLLGFCKDRKTFLRPLISSLLVLFFIFLSFKTSEQTKIWKNSQSLWSHVISMYPGMAIAYNNRGTSQTRLDLALADYDQTIRLDPEFPEAYFNRGKVYDQLGKYALAIADYTHYIAMDPYDAETYHRRSLAYKKIGELVRASDDQRKARSLGYVE